MHPIFAQIINLCSQIQTHLTGTKQTFKSDTITIIIEQTLTSLRITIDHGVDYLRIEHNTNNTITLSRQGSQSTMFPDAIGGFASVYYSCIMHWLEVCILELAPPKN